MEDIPDLLREMYGSEAEALGTHGIPPEDLDSEFEQLSVAFWKKYPPLLPGNGVLKKTDNNDPNELLPVVYPPRADELFTVVYPGDESKEEYHRLGRRFDAHNFSRNYKFVKGKKICISSEGICFWPSGKCYDKAWIAVHGMDSVCVVTRHKEADMTRVADRFSHHWFTNQQTMRSYAQAVISEVECLPYDEDKREYDVRKMFGQSIEKPFSVVSVVSDTIKVHEESCPREATSADYDEENATAFLKEKMKSGLAFTTDETIQTAISGFRHLCREELKAEDIWVTTLRIEKNYHEHMDNDGRKKHLAVISGGSSGGSSSSSGGNGPSLESDESPLQRKSRI